MTSPRLPLSFSCARRYAIGMNQQAAILAAVDEAFHSEQLPALRNLVNHPSHTAARDDVEAAAHVLDELARESGLDVVRHPASDPKFADHRVYSTPDAIDRLATALVGHIDTVHPRSSGFLCYSEEGDIARGPGVLDMKSGLTVALFALRALRRVFGGYEGLPVRVICVTDEEVGSPSSRDLYDALAPQLARALVFEKGRDEDRIITSRKGGGTYRIEAVGRAAHAGNDHQSGVNAIHALALLIPQIEAITDYARGITVNVGVIEGGTAKNTVPDRAACVIDVRFVTAATVDEVDARLREIVAAPLPERLRGATFALSGHITRPPMEATDANEALRLAYENHARVTGLGAGPAPRQGGFSDSNLLAAHQIPTIDGLGPYGKGDHSAEEWCSLTSLRRRTQALALYLAELRAR